MSLSIEDIHISDHITVHYTNHNIEFIPLFTKNKKRIRVQIGKDYQEDLGLNTITIANVHHSENEKKTISCSYLKTSSIFIFFQSLEEHILNLYYKKQKDFGLKYLDLDMLKEHFVPIIKQKEKSICYTNVKMDDNIKPIVKIVSLDESVQDGTWEDLKSGQYIIMDIHIKGIYIKKRKGNVIENIGLCMSLISCLAYEEKPFYSFQIVIPERLLNKQQNYDVYEDTDTNADFIDF